MKTARIVLKETLKTRTNFAEGKLVTLTKKRKHSLTPDKEPVLYRFKRDPDEDKSGGEGKSSSLTRRERVEFASKVYYMFLEYMK